MTDQEKYEMAAQMCRERALTASSPQKECLELYAELLPGIATFDAIVRAKNLPLTDYLAAVTGAAATMVASAIRTAAADDSNLINVIGPAVTADFSRLIREECFKNDVVFVVGKLDS